MHGISISPSSSDHVAWTPGRERPLHVLNFPDEPFSRLFPSTPTGTPKPITDMDRDKDRDKDKDKDRKPMLPVSMGSPDFELEGDNTGDELEKLGQMEGMPESVSSAQAAVVDRERG